MSMNLCFETKGSRPRYVDFPFQTPTAWTWEIIRAPHEQRASILRSKMASNPWLDEALVEECVDMLNDPTLELTYI